MMSVEEIEKNEFNLNLPRYIDSQTPEDVQDIAGVTEDGACIVGWRLHQLATLRRCPPFGRACASPGIDQLPSKNRLRSARHFRHFNRSKQYLNDELVGVVVQCGFEFERSNPNLKQCPVLQVIGQFRLVLSIPFVSRVTGTLFCRIH